MNVVLSKIKAFVQEEDGLSAVEYAVIAALIAAGLVVAFQTLGGEIQRVICDDIVADVFGGSCGGGGDD